MPLPRAAGVFRRFFDGHRGLQPHEVIEVLEKPELAPVIDCFLHVGRRSYGVDVQKGKTKPEMGKILLEPLFSPPAISSYLPGRSNNVLRFSPR